MKIYFSPVVMADASNNLSWSTNIHLLNGQLAIVMTHHALPSVAVLAARHHHVDSNVQDRVNSVWMTRELVTVTPILILARKWKIWIFYLENIKYYEPVVVQFHKSFIKVKESIWFKVISLIMRTLRLTWTGRGIPPRCRHRAWSRFWPWPCSSAQTRTPRTRCQASGCGDQNSWVVVIHLQEGGDIRVKPLASDGDVRIQADTGIQRGVVTLDPFVPWNTIHYKISFADYGKM